MIDSRVLGSRIKAARLHADLTQDELGHRTGYSQETISALERGIIDNITVASLIRLASATNQPLTYFVEDMLTSEITIPQTLRRVYPGIEEATIREIEAFAAWTVQRDSQMREAPVSPNTVPAAR